MNISRIILAFSKNSGSQPLRRQASLTTMSQLPTCKAGDTMQDILTPSILLDLEKFESNMRCMSTKMKEFPNVSLRPHAKAHKCPQISAMQVERGAVGICCQTLTEAEAMAAGGISDIFISNQVIGLPKLRRFVSLKKSNCTLSLCFDNEENLAAANEAAKEVDTVLDAVVEVNVGQNRCGVEPGDAVAELAQKIMNFSNLRFKGIQCYQGWNQHVRKFDDRRDAVNKVVELTRLSLKSLEAAAVSCDYVTGGGTGTFEFEAGSGLFTEVQPGSYVFMDVDYGKNFDRSEQLFHDYQQSIFVLSTIQSVSKDGDRAVVDAGLKALSLDSGEPTVYRSSKVEFSNGGDEHGILSPGTGYKVGQQVRLVPGHCDPTVNMYTEFVCVRDGQVQALWPISARGPGV